MKQFLLLFKTLYKAQNARPVYDDSKKKRLTKGAILALCSLPLIAIICAVLVFLTMSLSDVGELAVLSCGLVSAVQMMTLFLSLSSIITTLYSAKDIPLLSSLPLKTTTVFFAKFCLLYVNALKFSGVIIAPLLLTISITFNVVTGSVFYGIYPLILLIVLVAPILPLFIVTLFSMPLVYVGSFFKGKAVLKSIFSILIYVLLMAGYMVFIYFANTHEFGKDDIQMSQGMLSGLTTFSKVMYPNKVLVNFCLGIEIGKNFGISLAITVGMIAVSLLLAMFFYKRINTHSMESKSESSSVGNMSLKQSKIVPSLMRRDFKMIMSNSKIAMTSLANVVMAPLFMVVMYFVMNTNMQSAQPDEQVSTLLFEMINTSMALMFSMIFLGGANMLSGLAYTREGAAFFASKALPIRPIDSIRSKLALSCIVPACIDVVVMLIMLLLYKVHVIGVIIAGIDIMLVVVGVSSLNILFDMLKGNQYWKDATELRSATKTNTYQLVSALVSIVPALAIVVLGILLAIFCEPLGKTVILAIYWSVTTVISAVVCAVGLLVLKAQGEKSFEMIGEHKVSQKQRNRQQYSSLMR